MQKQNFNIDDKNIHRALEQVASGAFGNPIIFKTEPTNDKMMPNTWGKYGSAIYIKFIDGVGLKITGTTF